MLIIHVIFRILFLLFFKSLGGPPSPFRKHGKKRRLSTQSLSSSTSERVPMERLRLRFNSFNCCIFFS